MTEGMPTPVRGSQLRCDCGATIQHSTPGWCDQGHWVKRRPLDYLVAVGDEGGWGNPSIQRRQAMGKQIMLSMVAGGPLNPTWVEWLMGFPSGWTVLPDWGTRSSRKSLSSSDASSRRLRK